VEWDRDLRLMRTVPLDRDGLLLVEGSTSPCSYLMAPEDGANQTPRLRERKKEGRRRAKHAFEVRHVSEAAGQELAVLPAAYLNSRSWSRRKYIGVILLIAALVTCSNFVFVFACCLVWSCLPLTPDTGQKDFQPGIVPQYKIACFCALKAYKDMLVDGNCVFRCPNWPQGRGLKNFCLGRRILTQR